MPYFEGFRSDLGQKSWAPQTQVQGPRIQRPILGPLIKQLLNDFWNAFEMHGLFSSDACCRGIPLLGQKSCRLKVPRIFKIFGPNFAPNFAPEFFEDFSCFVSWERQTRKNSPKIPAIFQWKIPRQIRKKYSQNFSGEQAK